jgi:anthranilate synthase component 1
MSELERFLALAGADVASGDRGARVVPVWREIPFDPTAAVSAFAKIRRGPFAFLLESATDGGDKWARFTFMGAEPRTAWRLKEGRVEDWDAHRGWHSARTSSDPLADLERLLPDATATADPDWPPFWSGAVGFFGYDVVRLIESLPDAPSRTSSIPDALFLFTRSVVVIDNLRSTARIVIGAEIPRDATEAGLRTTFDEAVAEIEELERRLAAAAPVEAAVLDSSAGAATGTSSIERHDFIAGVDRIKEYIAAGDCFQALLSRRIELDADFDPAVLYGALRKLNPSPYMYHLVLDGMEIVGSSPELLVRLDDRRVTLRPIAGTRPRGSTAERDAELSKELLEDPKERAEHIMLVDLGRNDVGRVAKYGSVEVTELMKIEKYSHVLHIVSQVEGELAGARTAMDVLRATFPAGTMTGAPKVRAMQIIDELEPVSRGAYAGALGYIASGGRRMDLAITIRTCVIADGIASVQAGAGIVADSVGEREWDETESKARAVLTAIGQARTAGG